MPTHTIHSQYLLCCIPPPLIRVPSGKVPGDADLQFCANLSAFFSKV